ncbi:MAG: hypothetical protein CM1200mP29_11470 [Verrucomicrobiota bacterium]|nr:MAG: hypothetical protein CM1200mP29_11470 [Verrucomicrobiota bacterium]
MNAVRWERGVRLQKLLVFGIIMLLVLFLGYMLADDAFFAAFAFGGLAWWFDAVPRDAFGYLRGGDVSTALILPFFPGRPFIWEAAALLGWTGCVLVFSFRQYRDKMWDSVFEHKWMLLGVAGYCAVLILHDGTRHWFSHDGGPDGGRFYFQQLTWPSSLTVHDGPGFKEGQIRKFYHPVCLSATWVSRSDLHQAPGLFNILFSLRYPATHVTLRWSA